MTALKPPRAPAKEPTPTSAGSIKSLNAIAMVLGVIVFGLLAYGVIETVIKAAALFTG